MTALCAFSTEILFFYFIYFVCRIFQCSSLTPSLFILLWIASYSVQQVEAALDVESLFLCWLFTCTQNDGIEEKKTAVEQTLSS